MKFSRTMKIVGSVLGAVAAAVGIWAAIRGIYKPAASIGIVDVHFSSAPVDSFGDAKVPVIEVFVHNSGEHAALITEADFNVLRQWSLVRQFAINEVLVSSAQYDVVFYPAKDTPYVQTVPVSHTIKSDESDRLKFVLKPEPLKAFEGIYKFELSLRYNSTRETAKRIIAVVMPELTESPEYFYSAFDTYRKNSKVIGKYTEMISQEMNTPRAEQRAHEVDKHNREALVQVVSSPPQVEFQSDRTKSLVENARREAGATH
jgi:hypothetical protein